MRTSRPTVRQGIARSAGESEHPDLWRGLELAALPTLTMPDGTAEIFEYRLGRMVSIATSDTAPIADGLVYLSGSFTLLDISARHSLASGSQSSIVVPFWFNSSLSATISQGIRINANNHQLLYETSSNTIVTRTAGSAATCSVTPPDGFNVGVSAWNVGVSHQIFLNGVQRASTTTGDTSTSGTVDVLATSGERFSGLGALVYSRYIHEHEALLLYQDIYAPFRRRRRRVFSIPSAPPATPAFPFERYYLGI